MNTVWTDFASNICTVKEITPSKCKFIFIVQVMCGFVKQNTDQITYFSILLKRLLRRINPKYVGHEVTERPCYVSN